MVQIKQHREVPRGHISTGKKKYEQTKISDELKTSLGYVPALRRFPNGLAACDGHLIAFL